MNSYNEITQDELSVIKDTSRLLEASKTVTEAVQTRHSIRAYTDQPVDPELLRSIIEKSARAPSGGNIQPWKIIVLGGDKLEEMKVAIGKRLEENSKPDTSEYHIYPPELKEPYQSNTFETGKNTYDIVGVDRSDKKARWQQFKDNFEFFGAPVGLFCYLDRQMNQPQWSDAGMYLQTLMLLLREHGLSSCAQECWAVFHTVVDSVIKPPEEWMLFCGMSIGYADIDAPINRQYSPRMPLEEFAEFRGI